MERRCNCGGSFSGKVLARWPRGVPKIECRGLADVRRVSRGRAEAEELLLAEQRTEAIMAEERKCKFTPARLVFKLPCSAPRENLTRIHTYV